jgi:ubiquinone/menaquinone biosynthesis C-methylase UbiE
VSSAQVIGRESDLVTSTESPPTRVDVTVPADVFQLAADSLGKFFEPLSRIDRRTSAADFLDLSKSFKRGAIVGRYVDMAGKRTLEIGPGFGTNLAVWIRHFNVDGYGVEPSGIGFDQGFSASRMLLLANGIDPQRIVSGTGESLPFPDESFDIVYSANVLEHTADPKRVLTEAMRVLKPGGLLHMEMPNFLSYFEGHYMVFQPPILWKPMLAWWVKHIFHRNPAFAQTLQTQINPVWLRKTVSRLSRRYPLELISLGEDVFLERLSKPFKFETQATEGRTSKAIAVLQAVNRGNWLGRLIVALHGYYPIYLNIRKK